MAKMLYYNIQVVLASAALRLALRGKKRVWHSRCPLLLLRKSGEGSRGKVSFGSHSGTKMATPESCPFILLDLAHYLVLAYLPRLRVFVSRFFLTKYEQNLEHLSFCLFALLLSSPHHDAAAME